MITILTPATYKYALIVAFLFASVFKISNSFAESDQSTTSALKIGGIYLQAALNHEKNGIYNVIMSKALVIDGVALEYEVGPTRRIYRDLMTGKLDCAFPLSPKLLHALDSTGNSGPIIFSSTFHKVTYYQYFREEDHRKIIQNTETPTIGLPHRSETARRYFQLNPSDTIVSSSLEMMVQQLHRGRADSIIYAHPLPLYWSKKLNLGKLIYDANKPVLIDELAIGCHDKPANQRFITAINQNLKTLTEKGFIDKVYTDFYSDSLHR